MAGVGRFGASAAVARRAAATKNFVLVILILPKSPLKSSEFGLSDSRSCEESALKQLIGAEPLIRRSFLPPDIFAI